jgi:hypothetical protein
MATVTDGDRNCAAQADCDAHLNTRENIETTIAEYREACVREALDEQARRVFAALCPLCAEGREVIAAGSTIPGKAAYWVHGDSIYTSKICGASDVRELLDPDGRLEKPEA